MSAVTLFFNQVSSRSYVLQVIYFFSNLTYWNFRFSFLCSVAL